MSRWAHTVQHHLDTPISCPVSYIGKRLILLNTDELQVVEGSKRWCLSYIVADLNQLEIKSTLDRCDSQRLVYTMSQKGAWKKKQANLIISNTDEWIGGSRLWVRVQVEACKQTNKQTNKASLFFFVSRSSSTWSYRSIVLLPTILLPL